MAVLSDALAALSAAASALSTFVSFFFALSAWEASQEIELRAILGDMPWDHINYDFINQPIVLM